MNRGFEIYRRFGHRFVAGWLAPEVLEILAVLDEAQRSKNVSGAVVEIGVHHGRLFIGLKLLQDVDQYSVAIDVFGDQELNVDQSGKGDLAIFRRNVQRWSSLDAVAIHQGDSTQLHADQLRELAHGGIRLFSVDGGHTDPIVFSDMNLAEATIASGGIVVADDVFNEEWPGVSTGTLRYLSEGGQLVPFAIGFNKVFFASPDHAEYYRRILQSTFESRYLLFVKTSDFAAHEVLIIARGARSPRQILSRNDTARRTYHRIQEWRGVTDRSSR
jgi:hypothetical protein